MWEVVFQKLQHRDSSMQQQQQLLITYIDMEQHDTTLSSTDDTRLTIKIEKSSDSIKLQEDLNLMYEWGEVNNIMLIANKFKTSRT